MKRENAGGLVVILASAILVAMFGWAAIGDCYEDLVISGAGRGDANGTYAFAEIRNGKPLYGSFSDVHVQWHMSRWHIIVPVASGFQHVYLNNQDTLVPPTTGWYSLNAAWDPPPTISGGGAIPDIEPPVLVIPPDITIECDESSDPAHTGQATAADNCDPNPTITYTHHYIAWSNRSELQRTWTAADASGNSTSALQTIWITAPDVVTHSADPVWVNELPASVSVSFSIEKCATTAWLAARCNEDWSVHFASPEGPVIADGCTVNTQIIELPIGAPEGTYQLFWTMMQTPQDLLLKPGPSFLYGIDLTPPEIAGCPDDQTWYAAPGETTAEAFWDEPTVTDNLDPSPMLSATASSGDAFTLGTTMVSYTATDVAGNASSCEFLVTVLESVTPKGVAEVLTEALDGTPYDPAEIAEIVNIASEAIAAGAPPGNTSSLLGSLVEEGLSFDEFVERMEQYADLIEAGVPPGQAMNEVLGKGNSKK